MTDEPRLTREQFERDLDAVYVDTGVDCPPSTMNAVDRLAAHDAALRSALAASQAEAGRLRAAAKAVVGHAQWEHSEDCEMVTQLWKCNCSFGEALSALRAALKEAT